MKTNLWRRTDIFLIAGTVVAFSMPGMVLPAAAQKPSFSLSQTRNYDAMMSKHQESLRSAQQSGDRKAETDALFYLGLTRQQQAEAKGWGPDTQAYSAEAERYYKAALAIRPDLASALNNLAQLYLHTGREPEAEKLLKKAASGSDSSSETKRAFYAKNYADVVSSSQQDWATAQRYYRVTANAQPDNTEVQTKLVESYLNFNPQELGGYLWELVNNGRVLQAYDAALKSLDKKDLSVTTKEELLTIAAASLSRQSYNPDEFERSPSGMQLARLGDYPDIGEGALEILLLHRKKTFQPSDYRWWGTRARLDRDPPRGVWPRDAFRQLIRALGQTYRAKDSKLAESYYLLALTLNREEVDPQASLALADLYIEQGRPEALSKMLNQYAPELFYGKGNAYRRSQKAKIYEYHRTLGIIYSYVKQWGDDNHPDSAIFQLERAGQVAHELGCSPEPRMIAFLAKAYRETGQPDRARSLEERPTIGVTCGTSTKS